MAPTRTPVEQDKPQQVAHRLKLVDPETASKPIADALALLPVINVFRAMANAETLYPHFSEYMSGSQRVWPSSVFPGRRRHEVTANRCGWDRPTRDGIAGGVLGTAAITVPAMR